MLTNVETSTMHKHQEIKSDLISGVDAEIILQKHLIERKSYYFSQILKTPDTEYNIRSQISKALNIHINDVIVIGSAKLGFSPKTTDFKEFDQGVDKKGKIKQSDIDIAIVNRDCFDSLTYSVYILSNHFNKSWISSNWHRNRYYRNRQKDEYKNIYGMYVEYIAKGWFRPDLVPESFLDDWELINILEQIRSQLKRKVSVGIYSSWTFFKHYQMDNFNALRLGLMSGEDMK